ncbi:MAG: hypothetical protein QXX94_01000 [Candidatus Bathyarchaeia archaeon]
MKVLLISLCLDPLSELEFIEPIKHILRHHGIDTIIRHYTKFSPEDENLADKVIICGSALKDNAFLSDGSFMWLKKINKPVLGVGSGSQAIARTFNCNLVNRIKIGIFRIRLVRENKLIDNKKNFYAFFLTKRAIKLNEPLMALAKTGTTECIFKHKFREVYGCLFHPEVMNPEIITNFISRT